MRAAVAAVRAHDPARPIVVEGANMAQTPLPRAFYEELGVVAGLHFYLPMTVTHCGADHAAGMADGAPPPAWPSPAPSVTGDRARFGGEIARAFGMDSDAPWTRARLEESLAPWLALADSGVPVQVGECGVIRHTPHAVALAYLRDLLSVRPGTTSASACGRCATPTTGCSAPPAATRRSRPGTARRSTAGCSTCCWRARRRGASGPSSRAAAPSPSGRARSVRRRRGCPRPRTTRPPA